MEMYTFIILDEDIFWMDPSGKVACVIEGMARPSFTAPLLEEKM